MDKDRILTLSRQENNGKDGEWEKTILNKAATAARVVGLALSVLLVLADDLLFHTRYIGLVSWIIFFGMEGASNLILYLHFKKKSKLISTIVDISCAVIDTISLFLINLG